MLPIHCAHTAIVYPRSLKPHPSNPNEHGSEQISMFVEILKFQGWRRPITVSNRSGFITKGHGAREAALIGELGQVPVDYQDYETEAQELADIVADNQLARMSQMNTGKLQQIVSKLGTINCSLEMTGFKLDSLNTFLNPPPPPIDPSDQEDVQNPYTGKVKSPLYEPKGDKPELVELSDISVFMELNREIENSNIPEVEKAFLRLAAARHIVFNYGKIAEFYAHASKEAQCLMENSALVIIDFNKAIEKGFVVLADEIAEAYRNG